MTASDWIALYAAGVGTAALLWQGATYYAAGRPKLRVRMMLVHFIEDPVKLRDALSEIVQSEWRIEVTVLNVGRSPARISGVAIETNRSSSGLEGWTSSQWDLPWTLEPAEERCVFLTDDDGEPLTSGQDLTAAVTTTTGESFESEPLRVGVPGPVHELVSFREEHLSELLSNLDDAEKRIYTYRVQEFGDSNQ